MKKIFFVFSLTCMSLVFSQNVKIPQNLIGNWKLLSLTYYKNTNKTIRLDNKQLPFQITRSFLTSGRIVNHIMPIGRQDTNTVLLYKDNILVCEEIMYRQTFGAVTDTYRGVSVYAIKIVSPTNLLMYFDRFVGTNNYGGQLVMTNVHAILEFVRQ